MRGEKFQIALILSGIIVTALFAVFFLREVFPEYRIYQDTYVELEKFRSTYTHQPPPEFDFGVKQIVKEQANQGPPEIDRCITCHVATQYTHFSPTILARDENDQILRDEKGTPIQVANENYVWNKLDAKIQELLAAGSTSQAETYQALKIAQVGHHTYDMTKVLRMHPLIGNETRPFEYHALESYGCVSCHSGNGRGLTTEKAHGPVFDGMYEAEFMGEHPSFLEKDPVNDPPFAYMFNGKPGHSLLFQTTPIYVGNIIEAKCVQCHQPSFLSPQQNQQSASTTIDPLLQTYKKGYHLFFDQACYACHRITGIARGGIGPELSLEGLSYPWFVKESIVWPQADLKSSTMPNFHLDHEELEELFTFLMSQTGRKKTISESDYKIATRAWEAGEKQALEKPVSAEKIQDVRYGMTVFATEGCAACHRLQGFTSNVGFQIEKEATPNFEALQKEKNWFKSLFPEDISGKQLAKTLEDQSQAIDERTAAQVRENSILEEIEKSFPNTIETFYPSFKYAARSKNHLYAANSSELAQWKERLHRVLMLFIQEYGLGRLVGPRPNWAGVYRTDTWLMEHFRNPGAYVPRSIMPVFPFDDTKFYALTYMLNVLGRKNRDMLQQLWKTNGFNPQVAYDLYCSQCHGPFQQGNGPVAEWIYPIPKSLRNVEFMHQLSRERVQESIHFGVQGTPMPPWGEAPKDKLGYDNIPVLSEKQIYLLTDWLFSQIPGRSIATQEETIPKWNYETTDVLKELKKESAEQKFFKSSTPLEERDLFDEVSNPTGKADTSSYYIKQKYYTPQHLADAKRVFEIHCAPCHGRDADGSGIRASSMIEAKPRMLINLNWLHTRDDLRLLRSIKYGVQGTSMNPWGDQTSTLQRLQLVMYIRHLTKQTELREQLVTQLYRAYDTAIQKVDLARKESAGVLAQQKNTYQDFVKARQIAEQAIATDQLTVEEAQEAYQKELEALTSLKQLEQQDNRYSQLRAFLQKQKEISMGLGATILSTPAALTLFPDFLQMLKLSEDNFTLEDQNLKVIVAEDSEQRASIKTTLAKEIDQKIQQLQQQQEVLKGKILTPEVQEEVASLQGQIDSLIKLRQRLFSDFDELSRLERQQLEIYNAMKA